MVNANISLFLLKMFFCCYHLFLFTYWLKMIRSECYWRQYKIKAISKYAAKTRLDSSNSFNVRLLFCDRSQMRMKGFSGANGWTVMEGSLGSSE